MVPRPAVIRAVWLALAALWLVPATASAHLLIGRYESPLPLAAYLGGAAIAVALSFAIVILRSRPAASPPGSPAQETPIAVPRALRLFLRAIGFGAWLWIMVQGVVGGQSSDADVGSLFVWTYAWVGVAILCAFVGPLWTWLDPFATLYDLLTAVGRRLGVRGWRASAYPPSWEVWPAVGAFVVVVWLELVYVSARGGQVLAIAVALYTAWTLVMMGQYGRDTWRSKGEAFGVWFGLLGRVAPLEAIDADATSVRGRPFGAGLLSAGWQRSELVLVAVATGSILYDGLSQTQFWFDLFGTPSLAAATAQQFLFLAAIVALVVAVGQIVGLRAMGAGLVPIALGYLIAHYFTALAFDGQRIVAVVSDPFNVGWNLFGTATFEPNDTFIPFGIVWAIQLTAVVGGHVFGAVMGHRAAVSVSAAAPAVARAAAPAKARRTGQRAPNAVAAPGRSGAFADVRIRQIPLAVLMVFLTTLTLWSLGQNLVHSGGEATAVVAGPESARGPGDLSDTS